MNDPTTCPACAEALPTPARGRASRCPACGERLSDLGELLRPPGPRRVHPVAAIALLAGAPLALTFAALAMLRGFDELWLDLGMLGFAVAALLGGRQVVRDLRGGREDGVSLALGLLLGGLVVVGVFCLLPGLLVPDPRVSNGTAAIGALMTIRSAQELFREADKEGDGVRDYGTLTELGAAGSTGLIDAVLASGTKNGYLFQASYGRADPETLWFGIATPQHPEYDPRSFCTNQDGVIYFTTEGPFWFNDQDCVIPPGAVPIGR